MRNSRLTDAPREELISTVALAPLAFQLDAKLGISPQGGAAVLAKASRKCWRVGQAKLLAPIIRAYMG